MDFPLPLAEQNQSQSQLRSQHRAPLANRGLLAEPVPIPMECEVCKGAFDTLTRIPRQLQCGHTVCQVCLLFLASAAQKPSADSALEIDREQQKSTLAPTHEAEAGECSLDVICCPAGCRLATPVPPGGLEELPEHAVVAEQLARGPALSRLRVCDFYFSCRALPRISFLWGTHPRVCVLVTPSEENNPAWARVHRLACS